MTTEKVKKEDLINDVLGVFKLKIHPLPENENQVLLNKYISNITENLKTSLNDDDVDHLDALLTPEDVIGVVNPDFKKEDNVVKRKAIETLLIDRKGKENKVIKATKKKRLLRFSSQTKMPQKKI